METEGTTELSAERKELLARLLRKRAEEKREAQRVRPRGTDGPVPLSFAQQRLWFIHQLDPGSTAYNMPYPVRLRGRLDLGAMRRALAEVVRRHEALRTVFASTGGEPVQVVRPPAPVPLPVGDLSGLPAEAREREVQRLVQAEARRPFDLERGPLVRAALFRLADREWGLVFDLHHIISDGWSMEVLSREVSVLYGAFSRGEPSPLPPLAVQYPDYAAWQREWATPAVVEAQVRYWRETLEGAPPVLELPLDRPRPARPGPRGDSRRFALSPESSAALRELARREGVTHFVLLLAACQAMLARWSGQDDVSVGTPTAGRGRLELEPLIGMFVNTLVLRTRVAGGLTFRELLGRAREATLGAFAHQDVPFEKLVEELRVERSLRHTPLFQVMFSVQAAGGPEGEGPPPGELRMEPLGEAPEVAKFDLGVAFAEQKENFGCALNFRADLFEGATVERMAEHFRILLEAVAADPDRRLAGVEILDPAERRRVLEEWNATARELPAGSVHALFAEQAARTPDAVALAVPGGGSLTYAELDAAANRMASHLRGRGVGPETRVGICLERSPELVTAMLAVLKAGGAYVPLDTSYPAERLAYMASDARVRVVLTREGLRERLPHGVEAVCLDAERDAVAREGAGPPPDELGGAPERLAYVIYTSGSTGDPKGAAVPHRAVVRLVKNADYARLDAGEVFLQVSATGFDAATFEVWGALLNGARLVVPPPGVPTLKELEALVSREGVSTLWLTAGLFHLVADERPRALEGVRQLLAGGDVLSPDHVRRALEALPGVRLVNGYGPTENTTFTACHTVRPDDPARASIPIGRPVSNTRVYVLDGEMRPAPVGVPGELYAGGAGLARGYLDRPAATAEKWVPDPFSPEPGGRLYRTGDRVRWLADGTLEFLGRLDQQAKIRGFRIEPGEVEARLAAHPAVREAVVQVREDVPGEKRLVGYVVPAAEPPSEEELTGHLRALLPEYLVPSALVLLEELPLTAHGKLDRRALPAPGAAEAEYVAPRTPTEEILAEIWADVLKRERVGVTEDFFALGGHSLLATQVVSRAQAALGVDLPLRALFEAPTVAGMARAAEVAMREGAGTQAPPVVPVPRDGAPLPLSFAQQRLWFIDQLEPGSPLYNMPFPLKLEGPLDVGALRRTVSEVVRRHEALRTVFAVVDGQPVQVVRPAGPHPMPAVDLRGLPAEAREAETRRLAGADARRPFDLARGPLLRTTLLHADEGEYALLTNLHHIAGDAWSTGVLVREITALYAAFSEGRPSPLPELAVQYADFAAWQRGWLVGEPLERQIAYWKERLGGAPPLLELPTDHPRPAVASPRGGARGIELPAGTAAAVRTLARREGATPFAVLLAGFQVLLGRYAGEDDVLVGTAIAGRNRLETEGLIGFFVNTLVIRADLSGDPTARELVAQARERTLEGHAHQDLPFERLVDELRAERTRAHSPLFQAMFNFNAATGGGGGGEGLRLGDVKVRPMGADSGTEKFDMTLALGDGGDGFGGSLSYRAELWEPATIERMLGHYAALLEGMTRDPERPVSAVSLLPDAERAQVLEAWNATERPYPAGPRVHDLFAAQAARTPEAVAVAWRGGRVTYAELERRANQLAHALRRRGVGPETRVGIFLGRTPELVVALLGVLKAGGAYVPLDPAYPLERLDAMTEDAEVALVITEARLRGGLPRSVADALVLDREIGALAREPEEAPESGALPENLSHVIFTSGSTGRPKGVMIRHASVVVLLHWLRETVTDEERSAVLFSTSVNFDVSVAELFGTLCWGGKLVLVENALELPDAPEPVVYASMVPSAAAELLRSGGIPAGVRTLNLGGEALPQPLAQGLYALEHVEKVGNLYGPTEDTTYSTYSLVERGAEQVRVGRPVANTRAYVLDRHLGPVPAGVIGELYLAGDGLARGYARRPELTAERFLPDPFGAPGSRMYRVMDRVRWRADGELEYFGRTDFQVKVRGFRIELGEIEAALARHPLVRESVAVVREDAPGDRRIVAYVTAHEGAEAELDAAELRAHAGRHLPEYMVPSAVQVLESLPLSPNGKVNRRALPAPPRGEGAGAGGYLAPRDTLEMTLSRLFAEALGVEEVGLQDSFFELGGHSLLAVRLMSEVEKATGVRLPVATLFGSPTVERLAAEVRRGGGGELTLMIPIRPKGSRPPLFLVHPVGGGLIAYSRMARKLDEDQPVYGLRARGTESGEKPNWTVEEMAREYLAAIREVQAEGPYRLGGWSMGGVVAFEVARQLEAAGEKAEKLVLIDSHVPWLHDRDMPKADVTLVQTFAQDMGFPAEQLAPPSPETREAGELAYLREVLDVARAAGMLPKDLEFGRIEHLYGIFKINLKALYDYRPGEWDGRATLIRAAKRNLTERLFGKRTLGWERIVRGGVELRSSPGDHFSMVRETNAEALAKEVQRALDR